MSTDIFMETVHPINASLYVAAIQMTWDLALTADNEPIDKYQIYAYQETTGVAPSVFLWKFVGDVESLDLPMACTLTQVHSREFFFYS